MCVWHSKFVGACAHSLELLTAPSTLSRADVLMWHLVAAHLVVTSALLAMCCRVICDIIFFTWLMICKLGEVPVICTSGILLVPGLLALELLELEVGPSLVLR